MVSLDYFIIKYIKARIPITIKGQSQPTIKAAITATIPDGSHPSPTPKRKPYVTIQYIQLPIKTRIPVMPAANGMTFSYIPSSLIFYPQLRNTHSSLLLPAFQ